MSMITIDALIDAVKRSTRSIDVCSPSQDYDAQRDDWQTETIEFVDANYLVQELENMK